VLDFFGVTTGAGTIVVVGGLAILRSSSTGTPSSFSGHFSICDLRHGREGWLPPFLTIVPYSLQIREAFQTEVSTATTASQKRLANDSRNRFTRSAASSSLGRSMRRRLCPPFPESANSDK